MIQPKQPRQPTQHKELGHFLRSRRERVPPEAVGMSTGTRRRSRGLRREEVAILANLSPTWYTYLEQGRSVRPSAEILDGLADALLLNETERRYLHALGAPPSPQVQLDLLPPEGAIQAVRALMALSGTLGYPAYATDGSGGLLGWNSHTNEWYDDFGAYSERDCNMLRWMFTSPVARRRIADWDHDARNLAARLRFMIGTSRMSEPAHELVNDIRAECAEFDRWWDSHDVSEQHQRIRTFHHPSRGVCVLYLIVMRLAAHPSVTVVFHVPPGAPDSADWKILLST